MLSLSKIKKRNETHFLYLTLTVTLSPDPNHLTTRTTVHTVRVNVMHVPHHSTHAQYNVSMTYATFTPGPAPCTNLSRRQGRWKKSEKRACIYCLGMRLILPTFRELRSVFRDAVLNRALYKALTCCYVFLRLRGKEKALKRTSLKHLRWMLMGKL